MDKGEQTSSGETPSASPSLTKTPSQTGAKADNDNDSFKTVKSEANNAESGKNDTVETVVRGTVSAEALSLPKTASGEGTAQPSLPREPSQKLTTDSKTAIAASAPEVALPKLSTGSSLVQVTESKTKFATSASPLIPDDELEALANQLSVGFGESTSASVVTVTAAAEDEMAIEAADRGSALANSLSLRDGPESYKSILQPTIAFAIGCQHGRMALMKLPDKGNGSSDLSASGRGISKGGFWWLPYVNYESGKYVDSARFLATFFAEEFKEVEDASTQKSESSKSTTSPEASFLTDYALFSIFRYQIPDGQFISRYIFMAKWAGEKTAVSATKTEGTSSKSSKKKVVKQMSCCTDTANICWVSLKELVKQASEAGGVATPLMDRLWGYEVIALAEALLKQHQQQQNMEPILPQIQEFMSAEVLRYVPKPPPPTPTPGNGETPPATPPVTRSSLIRSATTSLLAEAKFTEADVVKVYGDYVQHCHPSSSMSLPAFADYIGRKLAFRQYDEAAMRALFRTFNLSCGAASGATSKKGLTIKKSKQHYLLFGEFLLCLGVLEPVKCTSDSKFRLAYIFRFYDRNEDGVLDTAVEFRRLVADLRYNNQSLTTEALEADVRARLAALKIDGSSEGQLLTFGRFLADGYRICEGGGAGNLLTTPGKASIREAVHTRHAYEAIRNTRSGNSTPSTAPNSQGSTTTVVHKPPFAQRLMATCGKCRTPKKYSLAYHTIRCLVPTATSKYLRTDDPRNLSAAFAAEDQSAKRSFASQSDRWEVAHSTEVVFNPQSVANKVLTTVRKLNAFHRATRDRQKELTQAVTKELTPALILALCKAVTEVVRLEPRVLKVPTPCYVIGDTHGNIHDVLTYEAQLWPLAPAVLPVSYLFLGDYVDRGDHGIEVISYLFAQKLLAPTKFLLLRGNHEIRAIQRNFTFFKECMIK